MRTPTYHVFDLYTDHQDAEWVDAAAADVDPFLDWTVSRKDGAYTIGLVNTGLEREAAASFRLPSAITDVISARALVGETSDAHNTFDAPDVVSPIAFDGYRVEGDTITVTLPPRAVASLRVETARDGCRRGGARTAGHDGGLARSTRDMVADRRRRRRVVELRPPAGSGLRARRHR